MYRDFAALLKQMRTQNKRSQEGARIRRLRLQRELTQEELAREVGLTTHTIWRLENDHSFNPRLQTLRAIAEALGVDVSDLLGP
ncbi:MAG: XRE family transcriptional regulator [Acidobacteria bacterium]|nr:MAG: XRE family transcriptional regulator [Acidobacteriota bacterium]